MKHPMRWILIGLVTVPLLLVVTANSIAVSPDELPPPDPKMLITLPDGREAPLFEVLARSDMVKEVIGGEPAPDAVLPELLDEPDDEDALARTREFLDSLHPANRTLLPPADGDIYGLANYSLEQGDHEQALALFRSLPKEHPNYGRAQRKIGWDIYTIAKDEPDRGLPFVNRSVLRNPTEGNAWQDAARVYAATLGFLVN